MLESALPGSPARVTALASKGAVSAESRRRQCCSGAVATAQLGRSTAITPEQVFGAPMIRRLVFGHEQGSRRSNARTCSETKAWLLPSVAPLGAPRNPGL